LMYPGRNSQMAPNSLYSRNPVVYGGELPLNNQVFNDLFDEGWSKPQENDGRMISERAVVMVALDRSTDYELSVQVQPSCYRGEPRYEMVEILWNSRPIGRTIFRSCARHSGVFAILQGRLRENTLNSLAFQLSAAPGSQAESASGASSPFAAEISTLRFIQK